MEGIKPLLIIIIIINRWMAFGQRRERCWANCPCNQFPRFPTYVLLVHQRYRRTDRETDGRTLCNCNTALCTKVHRPVISKEEYECPKDTCWLTTVHGFRVVSPYLDYHQFKADWRKTLLNSPVTGKRFWHQDPWTWSGRMGFDTRIT